MDDAEGAELQANPVLLALREHEVKFYDDQILVAETEDGAIYVPLRQICNSLGLSWAGQRQRTHRDPVLAEALRTVRVTHPNPAQGGDPEALALPLEMLPGWLFGINESRVKAELQPKINLYRRECFRALWQYFRTETLPTQRPTTDLSSPEALAEYFRAMAALAEQHAALVRQLEGQEQRLDTVEGKVSAIADFVRPFVVDTRQRLARHEERIGDLELWLSSGATISESQATAIALAVKNVAYALSASGTSNAYQKVWGELYRRYGVAKYRQLPAARYQQVLDWLQGWYGEFDKGEA